MHNYVRYYTDTDTGFTGIYNSRLTIFMSGADIDLLENNIVTIGNAPCRTIRAKTHEVSVNIGTAPPGQHIISVTVKGKGKARSSETYYYVVEPSVTAVYPWYSGLAGDIKYIHYITDTQNTHM